MEMTSRDWELINRAAKDLGVGSKALEKWKERGSVPHKWRIPLIKWGDGLFSLDIFDRWDEARR